MACPELPEGDGELVVRVVVWRRQHRHRRQTEDRIDGSEVRRSLLTFMTGIIKSIGLLSV